MARQEDGILQMAKREMEEKKYKTVRDVIYQHHGLCENEDIKVQLLRLWEESLYQEFISSRSEAKGGEGSVNLSSSMRYKLRKKHPCPIELEHELRVKNARLPKHVHDGLNAWLKSHKENPYPNKREKEALSTQLSITPQQVNRWFIQRRKMMRMRGDDYIGRFDSPEDDEMGEYMSAEHDEQTHGDARNASPNHMIIVNDPRAVVSSTYTNPSESISHSSLLEHILKNASDARSSSPNTPLPTHYVAASSLGSGGSVMDVSESLHRSKFVDSAAMVLTPPPSISGDSIHPRSARSTPPESAYSSFDNEQDHAIDLTASAKPVILGQRVSLHRPVSPHSHRDSRTSSGACSPVEGAFKVEVDERITQLERDAAHTLLCLARGGS